MHKYHCLNPIAAVGLDLFSDDYQKVEDLKDAEAVLVRSAAMHDLEPVSYTHLTLPTT